MDSPDQVTSTKAEEEVDAAAEIVGADAIGTAQESIPPMQKKALRRNMKRTHLQHQLEKAPATHQQKMKTMRKMKLRIWHKKQLK